MWYWLKNRIRKEEELPEFWNTYASTFKETLSNDLTEVRFIVLDTETTGFSFDFDRILSIGALELQNHRINVKNDFEVFIETTRFNPKTVPIHGIIKGHKYQKMTETEALQHFLAYIGNSVLVAHHAAFDINMLNAALKRMGLPPLKNKVLDTAVLFKSTKIINYLLKNDKNFSLDEVCDELNIPMHDRHTASGDALLTALAFLKIVTKLNKKKSKL